MNPIRDQRTGVDGLRLARPSEPGAARKTEMPRFLPKDNCEEIDGWVTSLFPVMWPEAIRTSTETVESLQALESITYRDTSQPVVSRNRAEHLYRISNQRIGSSRESG